MNKELKSFLAYSKKHPTLRFWQSLRNWSKSPFILKSSHFEPDMFNSKWLEKNNVEITDTFYE